MRLSVTGAVAVTMEEKQLTFNAGLRCGGILLTLRSKLRGNQVIFGANPLHAVESLEATHRKMTTGDVLEMVYERVVRRGATEGADYGKGLRGNLLREH